MIADLGVEELLDALAAVPVADSDPGRVSQIAVLERVKSVACGVQARVTGVFAASQRAQLAAAGCSNVEAGRSLGSQVALARRESPSRGSRYLGFAEALCTDMPGTLAALSRGETSEWRATLVVRETAVLSRADRRVVDAELAPRLAWLGDGATGREARRIGLRLDAEAAWRRARKAASDRRVTIRPAPDAMAILTATLPVAEGVACYAALCRAADLGAVDAAGPARSRAQIMTDTLTDRILGRTSGSGGQSGADGPGPRRRVPSVEVQLIMTDRALLDAGPEPAEVPGYGPIPAALARDLVTRAIEANSIEGQAGEDRAGDSRTTVFVRRLVTDPTGRLVAAESRRRTFPPGMARFLRTRDGNTCRTPWCDAPIRHHDHIISAENGGQTSITNGQGLCEHCNYTKQTPDWHTEPASGGTTTITTPTGHTHTSRPPPLPGVA